MLYVISSSLTSCLKHSFFHHVTATIICIHCLALPFLSSATPEMHGWVTCLLLGYTSAATSMSQPRCTQPRVCCLAFGGNTSPAYFAVLWCVRGWWSSSLFIKLSESEMMLSLSDISGLVENMKTHGTAIAWKYGTFISPWTIWYGTALL